MDISFTQIENYVEYIVDWLLKLVAALKRFDIKEVFAGYTSPYASKEDDNSDIPTEE